MKIRRNNAALRNIGLRQDVFGGPSLMRREEVLCPENLVSLSASRVNVADPA